MADVFATTPQYAYVRNKFDKSLTTAKNIATGDKVIIATPAATAPTAREDTQAIPMLFIYAQSKQQYCDNGPNE